MCNLHNKVKRNLICFKIISEEGIDVCRIAPRLKIAFKLKAWQMHITDLFLFRT